MDIVKASPNLVFGLHIELESNDIKNRSSSTSLYSPDPIGGISATVYIADVTIHIL